MQLQIKIFKYHNRYPIGGYADYKYVIFEIHYNNPNLDIGLLFESLETFSLMLIRHRSGSNFYKQCNNILKIC